MSSITQIQNHQINPTANQVNKKTLSDDGQKTQAPAKNDPEPVLNKMSQQLSENSKRNDIDVSEQQAQSLIPDIGVEMMGVQSGNITAEFVANLLNKSPYDK